MRTLHFKNKAAYRKWLAFGHMRTKTGKLVERKGRSLFATTKGCQRIMIKGRLHKVKHIK